MSIHGMQLQLTKGKTIHPNQPILFDEILVDLDHNISYNFGTGELAFQKPDQYYITWFVAILSGLGSGTPHLSIVTNEHPPQYYTASSGMKTGGITGFALLDVTEGFRISLVNTSQDILTLSPDAVVSSGLSVISSKCVFLPELLGRNTVIPFASGGTTVLKTNPYGFAATVMGVGYGSHTTNEIKLEGDSFTLTNLDCQVAFSLPYDGAIRSVYASFANWGSFMPSKHRSVFPYVILAYAPADSNTFALIAQTKTRANEPWYGGVNYPANTTLNGQTTGLNFQLPAGSRVMVVCAFETRGKAGALSNLFYYSGGIWLS